MELLIAAIALGIAAWQLKLQKDEIKLNGTVSSLIHIASLLKDKMEFHEKMIEIQKQAKQDWTGHAYRVNDELKPMLNKVNSELVAAIDSQAGGIDIEIIKKALNLESSIDKSSKTFQSTIKDNTE